MSGTWPRTLRCLQGDLPSVADPLIDCATTSFAINKKSCTGLRADRLPIHDRRSGTEVKVTWIEHPIYYLDVQILCPISCSFAIPGKKNQNRH